MQEQQQHSTVFIPFLLPLKCAREGNNFQFLQGVMTGALQKCIFH